MAGDWIPIRIDLREEPEVISIAQVLDMDEDHVVGKLTRIWGWANRHTSDGNAASVTGNWIDRYVSVTGFAQAMSAVGWLEIKPGSVVFPKFDHYNSKPAKQRMLTSKRVKKLRAQQAEKCNGGSVTGALPEKRREEKRITPPTPQGELVVEFPENLRTDAFRKAWEEWSRYRKETRHPLSPSTIRKQLRLLSGFGPDKAIAAIDASITNSWQGLFEPSSRNGRGSAESPATHMAETIAEMRRRREEDARDRQLANRLFPSTNGDTHDN